MSILIKGMDMPKDEELLCINIYPSGKVCIGLDLNCEQIATAVPVPPHGRLIDADAIKRELVLDYAYAAADMVDNAPTIIPAEEEASSL